MGQTAAFLALAKVTVSPARTGTRSAETDLRYQCLNHNCITQISG